MLTVKQLLNQSRSHRPILVTNSSAVSIAFAKPKVGKDARGFYRAVSGSARTNRPGKKTKIFEIRLYWPQRSKYIPQELREEGKPYGGPDQPPPFTIMSNVWVSCSCEYFLYHVEVADAEEDASSIKYSNGQGPKITNPQHIPHLCKHLISALRKGALVKK